MPKDQLVYVVDANILIDLYVGRVLWEVSRLPFSFVVPDLLIHDLQEPSGKLLIDYNLVTPLELLGEQIEEVAYWINLRSDLSAYDCSAFVLAKMLGVTLLSGDGGLRQLGASQGLPVHGTLWVLDQMLSGKVINHQLATVALELMLDKTNGRRLPISESMNKLKLWKSLVKSKQKGQITDK